VVLKVWLEGASLSCHGLPHVDSSVQDFGEQRSIGIERLS